MKIYTISEATPLFEKTIDFSKKRCMLNEGENSSHPTYGSKIDKKYSDSA